MNIVQIAGRLGRDPESRFTSSGLKVTNLTVATTTRKAGKEETTWWRVVIWGDRFDKMIAYLKKGSAVIAIGEMNKPEIWTDKEGRPQVNLELTADIIRFSPFGNPDKPVDQSAAPARSHNAPAQQPAHAAHGGGSSFASENSFGEYGNSSYGQGGSHSGGEEEEERLPF